MDKSNFDEEYREKLLRGEMTLQTREEFEEYQKIPPHEKIKGLEKMAALLNKLDADKTRNI